MVRMLVVSVLVVGCGSSESEPGSVPGPSAQSGTGSSSGSVSVAGWAPWAVPAPAAQPAPSDAPVEAVAELERIADQVCACPDDPCAVAANLRFSEFLGRYEGRMKNLGSLPAMARLGGCFEALAKKTAAAAQTPDAGPPAGAAPDAAPAVASATPDRPPGITEAHVARLDRMMARLTRLREDVTSTTDCKAAARAVTRHWKGFKPVKKVLREVNPHDDPVIASWLLENYVRPAFGAVGELVNKGMDGCDQVGAWNRAVEATDFMGTKNR